jgi:deazaflavin-dependent oxidoreductase (nitroreductase family)
MTEFNDRVIAEFRSNGGRVGAWGTSLVLVHHRGARTGKERVNPVMSLRDGDGWLVVGSAMRAARDPAWTTNLRANPDVEIEAVIEGEIATVPVHATELSGEYRRAAFARFVHSAPAFAKYQDKTSRPLPVIRLSPAPTR